MFGISGEILTMRVRQKMFQTMLQQVSHLNLFDIFLIALCCLYLQCASDVICYHAYLILFFLFSEMKLICLNI